MSLKNYILEKKPIGSGGNGKVYKAKHKNGMIVAIKIVHKNIIENSRKSSNDFSNTRLKRFEIEAEKGYQLTQEGQRGIIPVLEYGIPCPDTGDYFLVMPVAVPLKEVTSTMKDINQITEIFKELGNVLNELHVKNISHRDIKPDNILLHDEKYCFSDLGLIDFPEKEDLTRIKESLGNRKTMAPEMRTASSVDDSRPADVYSFAKTLWLVLTDEEYAFDGQFNYIENTKLQKKYPKQHLIELFDLLHDATYEDPKKRISIEDFNKRLIIWQEIAKNDSRSAESRWRFIERTIYGQVSLDTAMWRNPDKVIEVLEKLANANFNHTFIHDGGGMDLLKIEKCNIVNETDMLQLYFGVLTNPNIMKLERLVWESPNNDPKFSYFRLEFKSINPIFPEGVKYIEEYKRERWGDIEKEVSEDLNVTQDGEYKFYDLNKENEFQITRWFNGVFLIVYKGSIYNNLIHNSYDGRHSKFDTDQFRDYMETLQKIYYHPLLKQYFRNLAEPNPLEDGHIDSLKELLSMNDTELQEEINKQQEDNEMDK